MKTKTKDLWKPIRKGAIYCSPRCGGGCLHSDFVRVTELAKTTASLLGKQWKTKVWENLGWYWSVTTGNLELHKFGSKYWWADLQVEGKQYTGRGTTATKALKNLRSNIVKVQKNIELALAEIP